MTRKYGYKLLCTSRWIHGEKKDKEMLGNLSRSMFSKWEKIESVEKDRLYDE
jgi:hypothetical protein